MTLHYDVRLLCIRRPTLNAGKQSRSIEPIVGVIVMQVLSRTKCATTMTVNATSELLLNGWKIGVVVVDALFEGFASIGFDLVGRDDNRQLFIVEESRG